MKYNRSEIMKAAWRLARKGCPMHNALRIAWSQAKEPYRRYDVYGFNILDGSRVLVASNLPQREAYIRKDSCLYSYDRVDVTLHVA